MCNAWNHSRDCRCGFGGDTFSADASFVRYENYLTPFARCPVCRAPVFYFEDRNGGRVFFDELGPPWPEHPCTDHVAAQPRVPTANVSRPDPGSPDPFWIKERWLPFHLSSAEVSGSRREFIIRGVEITEKDIKSCILTSNKEYFSRVNSWVATWLGTNPTFIRRNGFEFEISGISVMGCALREHSFKGSCLVF
jgi:hypothetical protein